jgi:hypothetical protein
VAVGASIPTRDIGTTDLYFGSWGQGLLTDWWERTADLIWPQSIITYGRMRHDPQLRGIVSAYLLPMLRATWCIDGTGCRDEVVAHVAGDLGLPVLGTDPAPPGPARRTGVSWRKHLATAAYSHLVYGHQPFELRYRIDSLTPGGVHLDHLGARMPWTLAQIHLNQDGTIEEIVQVTQRDPIPANRLLWYVHDQEGANWAGISILRPVFGMWLLKHETMRVHASSIRRFGMGVPTVTAPPGATVLQVQEANDLAAGFRAGDQAGVGLPTGYDFKLSGMSGNVPDALNFLKWLDLSMAKMALAGLVELGQTDHGSRALGETFLDLFLLSLQAVADDLADTATSGQDGMPGICTDLVLQNWGEDEPVPRVVCTDVGENYEVTAEALGKLTQFGAMSPDPALDDWIRKTWRLPARETAWEPTSRGIPAPGAPAGPVENVPGVPGDSGLPEPPQTSPAPGGPVAASLPRLYTDPTPRRQLTPREVQAGFDAVGHQRAWIDALHALVAQFRPIRAAWQAALVDGVTTGVDKKRTAQLGSLTVPAKEVASGAALVSQAMVKAATDAAHATIDEAASQGVTIPVAKVKLPAASGLGKVAEARAALLAGNLARAAGTKALQVTSSTSTAGTTAGAQVDLFLAGMGDRDLFDQLGAALTAAQNAGRGAVLDAAPESAGQAVYVASEINDQNECDPCSDIDNTEFASLAEAQAAYPNGGYLYCDGGMRCRGTYAAIWGGA